MAGRQSAEMAKLREYYFELRSRGVRRQAAADLAGVAIRTARHWDPATTISEYGFQFAKAVVDERAGKTHSDSGVVMSTLREAIQAYEVNRR